MYNDDAGLGGAIDDAVLASRCVGSWPAQLKALQEAEPRMLEQEELELRGKAKGLGFGVAALLFASAGRLLSLDLSDAGLGSTEIAAVAGALKALGSHSRLQTLKLNKNTVGPSGARALAKLVRGSECSLTSLELSSCDLCDSGRDTLGLEELAEAFGVMNGVLTNLDIGYSSIGNEGATALASALRVNGVLTKLSLFGNGIGDEGAKAIGGRGQP